MLTTYQVSFARSGLTYFFRFACVCNRSQERQKGRSLRSVAFRCHDNFLNIYSGKLDPNTREWSDGLFTTILRRIAASTNASHRHWIVFDGDLDPDWVESLNSVLDDNKTLTLPNGERIELLPSVRVIFEVRDIGHGTPATVSRCGMVWFAEDTVPVDDLLQRYMSRLQQLPLTCVTSEVWSAPSTVQPISDLQLKICAVLEPLLARDGFLSSAVKLSMGFNHIMPVGTMQLCSNVMSLLARFLDDVSAPSTLKHKLP
jgi:dynein heavy chain 1